MVDGRWHGVTASSFGSVSLDPPLVSVCLARSAFAHDLVRDSGVFGVTILAKDQAELGQRFARYDPAAPDRFAGDPWETASTGAPLLGSSLGWLDCSVAYAHPGGDHTIFVGEVLAAATPRTTSPLLYHSRTWGQFADQLPGSVTLVPESADDLVVAVDDVVTATAALRADAARSVVLTGAFSVDPHALGTAVAAVAATGPREVVLADDGTADPVRVREACREAVLQARPVPLAVRLAESPLSQANLLTALKSGVARIRLGDGAVPVPAVTLLADSLGLPVEGATA